VWVVTRQTVRVRVSRQVKSVCDGQALCQSVACWHKAQRAVSA
jgi:hypothetical protein